MTLQTKRRIDFWLGGALLLLLFPLVRLLGHVLRRNHSLSERRGCVLGDWLFVSVVGLVPSVMWLMVMVNHAVVHPHYLYRHLFLAFFLWLLFVSVAVVKRWPVRKPATFQTGQGLAQTLGAAVSLSSAQYRR